MALTIVVDPGHGGRAPAGASSPLGARGPSGVLEKDVTLALAQRLSARLGGAAVLTRSADVNVPLSGRCAMARERAADVFLSLHANEGPPGARGSQVFTHRHASRESRALARALGRELAAFGGPEPREDAAELAVLDPRFHAPHTAACLVEVDYLSDRGGEARLRDGASLDRIAAALARAALCRYGDATSVRVTHAAPAHRYRQPASNVTSAGPFRLTQVYAPENELGFEFAAIGVEPTDPVEFEGPVSADLEVALFDASGAELARDTVHLEDQQRAFVTFTGSNDQPLPQRLTYEVTVYNRYRQGQTLTLRMWTYAEAQ